jgi:photosystem II stability/assembly factor-like uncharacterized protein
VLSSARLILGEDGAPSQESAPKAEKAANAPGGGRADGKEQGAPRLPDKVVEGVPEDESAIGPPPPFGGRAAAGTENFNALNVRSFLREYAGDTENGQTLMAAVFDEGLVKKDHREFLDPGPASRVIIPKPAGNPDPHSTGVASVLAAWGSDPDALGMARLLGLYSYTWTDDLAALRDVAKQARVSSDVDKRVRVSNHSYTRPAGWKYLKGYGWVWYGYPSVDSKRDAQFGKYTKDNAELDRILFENRHLLTFVASGNALSKKYKPPNPTPLHWERAHPSAEFKQTAEARDPNDSMWGGCDTIAGLGLSKNAICVGAATATDDTNDPIQVASFSSWGPADDWRIKPDLIGVGESVHVASCPPQRDYEDEPGSSFASPAVAGVGALLVEFSKKRSPTGAWPTSAEIKAVMIHTARDAMRPGPDPETGWGLVNALEAGRVIRGEEPGRILRVDTITAGQQKDYPYVRPATNQKRLRVTLVWTDPPAPPTAEGLDVRTKTLVHDLDVELYPSGGGIFYPYSLDQTNPRAAPTTTGANTVDNVEVIDLDAQRVNAVDPTRGEWTVRVRADHLPPGTSQEFALIVSSLDERRQLSRNLAQAGAPAGPVPAPPPPTGVVEPRGWTHLGPRDLGGPTRALLIHPNDRRMMWAGCSAGGVWRTDDGGQRWTIADSSLAAYPVCTLALDPSNTDVLYAGTGDGSYSIEARKGSGIYKSTDSGVNWSRLPATAGPDFSYVNRLAIAPDGRCLLAATRTGLFRSTDGGQTFSPVKPAGPDEFLDVAFHPTDGRNCLAGGRNVQVFVSSDGGLTWVAATGLPSSKQAFQGRVELTYARKEPSVVYASVDVNNGEIYRSADGGRTFRLRSTGSNYLGSQGWYNNVIWAGDPNDPNLLLVGGEDVYLSPNGGEMLTQISEWWRASSVGLPHAYHHAIVERPGYNGTTDRVVFFGTDGGIYRNDNIATATPTTGWGVLNNGYDVAIVHGAAGSPSSGVIVMGLYGQGTRSLTPGQPERWSLMFGGNGATCAADPADPRFLYGEYNFLQIHRSIDGGKSSNYIFPGITDAEVYRANFFAPFILDPNRPETMLAGGASLWRSRDVKAPTPRWSVIKEPAGSDPDHYISAIAVARANSDLIWVGHNNGKIYKTTDGTAEHPRWKRLEGKPLPQRFCTRIVIAPQEPATVYATFGGYFPDNLWKTTDGGETWKVLGAGLPGATIESLRAAVAPSGPVLGLLAVPIYALAMHPDNPNFLYVGNEFGVFASADGGQHWAPTNTGPTNCPVSEMFWMNKVLVVATRGRGLHSIDLSDAVH